MQTENRAFTAIVHGRVQGVGFRYSTQRYAQQLGLTGYVQNRYDGTVKVVAEGPAEQIDQLKAWLKKGPPGAYVSNLDLRDSAAAGIYRRFTIEF